MLSQFVVLFFFERPMIELNHGTFFNLIQNILHCLRIVEKTVNVDAECLWIQKITIVESTISFAQRTAFISRSYPHVNFVSNVSFCSIQKFERALLRLGILSDNGFHGKNTQPVNLVEFAF